MYMYINHEYILGILLVWSIDYIKLSNLFLGLKVEKTTLNALAQVTIFPKILMYNKKSNICT